MGVGSYTLAARATDDKGAQTTSTSVTVTVSAASATIFYIYTDQLNTPRAITNEVATTIWRWDNNDPFGANAPNEDPDGDTNKFAFNLRFPGQYFDKETGTHYNYFRDYDPNQGRYIQSDVIGLFGGINSYVYVDENPLGRIDPDGTLGPVALGAIAGGIIGAISGGVGASVQNQSVIQGVIVGAAVGAAAGAVGGLIVTGVAAGIVTPVGAVVGVTLARAAAGALGNIIGQA